MEIRLNKEVFVMATQLDVLVGRRSLLGDLEVRVRHEQLALFLRGQPLLS